MKSPVFIISLPRSGSTLLQKVLMSHKEITSVSEPWILLPYIYASKKDGLISEYSQGLAHLGLTEFIDRLPKKKETYNRLLSEFIHKLYSQLCSNGETYFIDKTPRYYLIIPEIYELFPDAKFIFIFRNPVQIFSSILTTWCSNRFHRINDYYQDLTAGPALLSQGYDMIGDNAYALTYEDFVQNPDGHVKAIMDYLELDFDEHMLSEYHQQKLTGSMGDPQGVFEYDVISTQSLDKWKETFSTRLRKKILERYINSLNEKTLATLGYSKQDLLDGIQNIPSTQAFSACDIMDITYTTLFRLFKPNIIYRNRHRFLS